MVNVGLGEANLNKFLAGLSFLSIFIYQYVIEFIDFMKLETLNRCNYNN